MSAEDADKAALTAIFMDTGASDAEAKNIVDALGRTVRLKSIPRLHRYFKTWDLNAWFKKVGTTDKE